METLMLIVGIISFVIVIYLVYKQGQIDGEKIGLAKGYKMIDKLVDDYFNKKEKK